jgi:hypothetical protein
VTDQRRTFRPRQHAVAENTCVGVTNSPCAPTVRISRDPASAIRRSKTVDRRSGSLQRWHRTAGPQPVEQEQCRDRVTGPIHAQPQAVCAQQVKRPGLERHHQQGRDAGVGVRIGGARRRRPDQFGAAAGSDLFADALRVEEDNTPVSVGPVRDRFAR